MAIDFTDITKNLPGGNNMGGIGQTVYYALHKDVAEWPVRPKARAGITMEQMGELTGNIKMKAGKKMNNFYVTDDEGKLDFEGVGEKDGKSFISKLRVYNPGLQSKLLGFINIAKNENLVFIIQDCNGGLFLLGDELHPVIFDSIDGMTTGQKTEERPGAGIVFTYKTAGIYRYKGTIPLTILPTTIRACCPDGVDDYLSFSVSAFTQSVFIPSESQKITYIIDLIPGDIVFGFAIKNQFLATFAWTGGNGIMYLFINGKGYGGMFIENQDHSGIRSKVVLELGISDSLPTFDAWINDEKKQTQIIEQESLTAPTENSMHLLEWNSSMFDGTLFSFEIKTKERSTAKWDFLGTIPDECLKNKSNDSFFHLTANNVADMNQFIKDIPIPA